MVSGVVANQSLLNALVIKTMDLASGKTAIRTNAVASKSVAVPASPQKVVIK